ncbi:MAG: uroporphyrinogen-III synthase [Gammaproteobacteria bacterium]|nr:uroporphyrinogen-III synthase [Gammaproteobacteria bacterium]
MPDSPHKLYVTRPQDSGKKLANLLNERGLSAEHLPLINLTALNPTEQPLGSLVIFISPSAVQYANKLLWLRPLSEHLNNRQIFSVGAATAEQLKDLGVNNVVAPEHASSEGLINTLKSISFAGKNVTIVCGLGGRELLQTWLTEQGAKVHRLEVYRREPVGVKLPQKPSDIWIVSSTVAIDALKNDSNNQFKLIVTSKRLEHYALERGFKVAFCASSADNRHILEEVTHFMTDPKI